MKHLRHLVTAALLGSCASGAAIAGILVDLAAEASRPAANDLLRASVYSEAAGNNPAELARKVNADIGEALKLIRSNSHVTVKSGAQNTYPVAGNNRRIDSWRMRSELIIESRDSAAVSELLGRLQQMKLAVGDVSQSPAPETRRRAEDDAMRDAIANFQQRATLIGQQLGKTWRIKQLNVQQNGSVPILPMLRAAPGIAMAAEAMPAPLEAGETQITTVVSGQIEVGE